MEEKKSKNEQNFSILQTFIAEFIGTAVLILIGCSSIAAMSLDPENQNKFKDRFGSAFAFSLAAFIGIASTFIISGAHINPAVTIAFATLGRFPWKRVIPYLIAQYLGAFTGAALCYVTYMEAINNQHTKLNSTEWAYGHRLSTGGIFATYPIDTTTLHGALIDQIIGTASLLFCVMAVIDEHLNIPKSMQPFILCFVVTLNGIAFGYNVGAPLNPARDLGPRVFTAIAGWGIEVFKPLSGHYWYIGGIIGPHIGAIIGVWVYYFFIEKQYQKNIVLPQNNNHMLTDCVNYKL